MTTPTFTDALQVEVATLQANHPILAGALDKAYTLVVDGGVFPLDDGRTAHVQSQSDPRVSHVVNGTCDCKATQYHVAPCAHRLAFRVYQRTALRLTEGPEEERWEPAWASSTPPAGPLPEAPASVNCHLTISGRQVQLTLRDRDETRLLARLAAVLALYPAPQPPALAPASPQVDTTPQCEAHGALKRSTKGKGWYCPQKRADGSWCPSKAR